MNSILPNTEYSVTQSQFLQLRFYNSLLPIYQNTLNDWGKMEKRKLGFLCETSLIGGRILGMRKKNENNT